MDQADIERVAQILRDSLPFHQWGCNHCDGCECQGMLEIDMNHARWVEHIVEIVTGDLVSD